VRVPSDSAAAVRARKVGLASQIVKIVSDVQTQTFRATKLTGDRHVPAGELSFVGRAAAQYWQCEIQVVAYNIIALFNSTV
jgi:hypothetical protein